MSFCILIALVSRANIRQAITVDAGGTRNVIPLPSICYFQEQSIGVDENLVLFVGNGHIGVDVNEELR